jgi:hypothetical protein
MRNNTSVFISPWTDRAITRLRAPCKKNSGRRRLGRQKSGLPQKVCDLGQKLVPRHVRHSCPRHKHQVRSRRQTGPELSVRFSDAPARTIPYDGSADFPTGDESRLTLVNAGSQTEQHHVPALEDGALLVCPLKVALAPESLP